MLGTQRVRHLFSWRVNGGKAVAVETGEAKDREMPWWAVRVSSSERRQEGEVCHHTAMREAEALAQTCFKVLAVDTSPGKAAFWLGLWPLCCILSILFLPHHGNHRLLSLLPVTKQELVCVCEQVFRSGSRVSEGTSHMGLAHGISSTVNTPALGGPSALISVLSSCLCGPVPGQGQ